MEAGLFLTPGCKASARLDPPQRSVCGSALAIIARMDREDAPNRDTPPPAPPEEALVAAWEDAMARRERGEFDKAAFRADHPGCADSVIREIAVLDRMRKKSLRDFVPGQSAASALALGAFGEYVLERELGRGGQGIVYLARDRALGRHVALKVLTEAAAQSDFVRQRFKREAEAASRLDHPGICSVYAIGEEKGIPFIAMRYVEGESLGERIDRQRAARGADPGAAPASGSSSLGEARRVVFENVQIVEKAGRALHVAHEAGLVHRDVKPGNIAVTESGEPVLLDFGLAHDLSDDAPRLTASGYALGTPAYMAPEQLDGRPVDRRTDTYALGVTLFECLTGELPFAAATRDQLCTKILHARAPNPRTLNPAVSRDLAAITEVALDKDPDRRYATAAAFADDLERVRTNQPIQARPPSTFVRLHRWAKRRPALAVLCAVLLVGVPSVSGLIAKQVANREKVREAEEKRLTDRVERLLEAGFLEASEVGDLARTTEIFEEALRLRPNTPEALLGLVGALLPLRGVERALTTLNAREDLIDRHPELKRVRTWLRHKTNQEIDPAERAASEAPPKTALGFFVAAVLAKPACDSNDRVAFERALQYYYGALLRSPRPIYYFESLHMAQHLGDRREIDRLVSAIESRYPESAEGARYIGNALANFDRRGATEALRRATALQPDNARAQYDLSFSLWKSGEVDAACDSVRRAIELSPTWSNARCFYANLLLLKGDRASARRELERALDADPGHVECHYRLAALLTDVGELEAARDHAITAVELKPDAAPAHLALGRVQWRQRDHDGAITSYRRAIELNPNAPRALCNLALVLRDAGELAAALTAITKGHELGIAQAQWPFPSARWFAGIAREAARGFREQARHGFADADPLPRSGEAREARARAAALATAILDATATGDESLQPSTKRTAKVLVPLVRRLAAITLSPEEAEVWSGIASRVRALGSTR